MVEATQGQPSLARNSPSIVPRPGRNRSEAAKPISKIIGCSDVSLTAIYNSQFCVYSLWQQCVLLSIKRQMRGYLNCNNLQLDCFILWKRQMLCFILDQELITMRTQLHIFPVSVSNTSIHDSLCRVVSSLTLNSETTTTNN